VVNGGEKRWRSTVENSAAPFLIEIPDGAGLAAHSEWSDSYFDFAAQYQKHPAGCSNLAAYQTRRGCCCCAWLTKNWLVLL